jgi:hypothetical protein
VADIQVGPVQVRGTHLVASGLHLLQSQEREGDVSAWVPEVVAARRLVVTAVEAVGSACGQQRGSSFDHGGKERHAMDPQVVVQPRTWSSKKDGVRGVQQRQCSIGLRTMSGTRCQAGRGAGASNSTSNEVK